jgi:hypothetical protein
LSARIVIIAGGGGVLRIVVSLVFAFFVFITLGSYGFFAVRAGTVEGEIPSITSIDEDKNDDKAETIDEWEALSRPVVLTLNVDEDQDLIITAFRDPELREEVLAFFEGLTGSYEVAEVILANSHVLEIPPALAFSLCAEESAYKIRALNRNQNNTIDRGLFQLNSASFPKLEPEDFFDPIVNTWHGLSYLRWCLDTAGTDVAGLAMYNAGITRVRQAGTPKTTLDYISRILDRRRKIEERFIAEYVRLVDREIEIIEVVEEIEKAPFRLSLLKPLGR